jgi:hypothetical protein
MTDLFNHGPERGTFTLWRRTKPKLILDDTSFADIIDHIAEADRDTVREHWGLMYLPAPDENGKVIGLGAIYYGQQILDLVDATRL